MPEALREGSPLLDSWNWVLGTSHPSTRGSQRRRGGLSLGLIPNVRVLTAEAKAAEAAASAYYNPGNPHNVYMPTVSGVGVH